MITEAGHSKQKRKCGQVPGKPTELPGRLKNWASGKGRHQGDHTVGLMLKLGRRDRSIHGHSACLPAACPSSPLLRPGDTCDTHLSAAGCPAGKNSSCPCFIVLPANDLQVRAWAPEWPVLGHVPTPSRRGVWESKCVVLSASPLGGRVSLYTSEAGCHVAFSPFPPGNPQAQLGCPAI